MEKPIFGSVLQSNLRTLVRLPNSKGIAVKKLYDVFVDSKGVCSGYVGGPRRSSKCLFRISIDTQRTGCWSWGHSKGAQESSGVAFGKIDPAELKKITSGVLCVFDNTQVDQVEAINQIFPGVVKPVKVSKEPEKAESPESSVEPKPKKPAKRGNILVFVWQSNSAYPSVSLKDMRLQNSQVKQRILSGIIGGGPAEDKFEIEVDLNQKLWRWKYPTKNDEFSQWFKLGEKRQPRLQEGHASGELRGVITVFDHTMASQVSQVLHLIHELQDDRGSISVD